MPTTHSQPDNDHLFNVAAFNECIQMAAEVKAFTGNEYKHFQPKGTTRAMATSFNSFAEVPGATNYCGQSACASIIKAWGHHQGKSDLALATEIYSRFPPDLLGGKFGTSPARIAEILKAYGFKPEFATISVWLPGGFLNPANQVAWQLHRSHIEDQWVKTGFPVITLVDGGMVGGDWYQPHWVPVISATNTGVTIGDALFDGMYSDHTLQIDRFHEAWEVRFLPGLNFVSILPQPL